MIQAGLPQVWDALLNSSEFVTPGMRRTAAQQKGVVRFPARPAGHHDETSPVPGVNVEINPDNHTLVISGQWWFRGTYELVTVLDGTRLSYRVENVASAGSRWLVPLVARSALQSGGRSQFVERLDAIGVALGCAVSMEP
jgi:hypothetical protein